MILIKLTYLLRWSQPSDINQDHLQLRMMVSDPRGCQMEGGRCCVDQDDWSGGGMIILILATGHLIIPGEVRPRIQADRRLIPN